MKRHSIFCRISGGADSRRASVAFLLALCLAFSMSACGPFMSDTQALMSPPKANLDQQDIHTLLQRDNAELSFAYPKSGENRSAITMHDFTGNGSDDAVGFIISADGSIEVQFLTKTAESGWKSVSTFSNAATQVDRVMFGDLSGDGTDDVIIGWGSPQSLTATLCVYVYDTDSSGLSEHALNSVYGEATLTDFDGDGVQELFTAEIYTVAEENQEAHEPAKASVFSFTDEQSPQLLYSVQLDNSVARYSSISFAKLSSAVSGVVLDGAKADSSLITQILYLDSENVFTNAPPGVNDGQSPNLFYRPQAAGFISRDINDDGIIEIPVAVQLPALPDATALDTTSYMVSWSRYSLASNSARPVLKTLMNLGEGYWFKLPEALEGKITASNDTTLRTVTYSGVEYDEESGNGLLGTPLFRIRVFTVSAWSERGNSSGYELLTMQSDLVYAIQVLTSDEELLDAVESIKESFALLNVS